MPLRLADVGTPPGETPDVWNSVRELWQQTYPSTGFDDSFLDQTIEERYLPDSDLMEIIGLCAIYAILISCLGTMGMVARSVEQRKGEIGIRKAVGATALQILSLLTRETLVMVGVAALLGVPLALYVNELWLANFARRVDVGFPTYAYATLITTLPALGTAGLQALRGAWQEVTTSLRSREP